VKVAEKIEASASADAQEEWLRAFISSETDEFREARIKIAETLRARHVKPVYWKMLEKPSGLTLKEFYLQHLETCQLYIGIFGEKDSPGTEDEYREAVTTGLERWVFIKEATHRDSQIQRLIELAEKEVVREKFTTDEDLRDKIDERIQNFLSQSTREYLELRKRRTHEFLTDYRTKFLEPLLEQVQLVRNQLRNGQDLHYSDYWTPDKIRNHPYFSVDSDLNAALENFFTTFSKCELSTAAARRAYESNCKASTEFHLVDYVVGMTPDAQNRAYQQMEALLYQTDLMNCKDLNQLTDAMLSNIVEQAKGRLASVLPDPSILITSRMHDSLRLLVKGVIERDSKNNDIRTYLAARTELERSANRAHEMLWKRFAESTGYQS
jgi:hypothetical protein